MNDPTSGTPQWYTLTSSETAIFVYLIKAYVSFGVTDVEEQIIEILPNEFSVAQNYPNPFNPSTKIDFTIPTQSKVKLTVYNSMGELVRTIIDKEIGQGQHSINFDGKNLSSGIYFYRLLAGDNITTRKMMLIK